jgi:MraZ protein
MFEAKLDDKGRLKMPVEFQKYLGNMADKSVYVTSLDRRTALIYPIDVWKENEKFFENFTDDPETAERVAFNAADLGGETVMDSQGRIPFPSDLREELGIENKTVRLQVFGRRIQVLSEQVYTELKTKSTQSPASDVKLLQKSGLK